MRGEAWLGWGDYSEFCLLHRLGLFLGWGSGCFVVFLLLFFCFFGGGWVGGGVEEGAG